MRRFNPPNMPSSFWPPMLGATTISSCAAIASLQVSIGLCAITHLRPGVMRQEQRS